MKLFWKKESKFEYAGGSNWFAFQFWRIMFFTKMPYRWRFF